jgi:hypothetical protein
MSNKPILACRRRERLASGPKRIAIAVFALALIAGCAPHPATLKIGGVEFTQAEFKYGLNVNPDPSVKFADDVVVVHSGAQAVRSVTGDGLTWTLDPGAADIDKLVVGKVMFLTANGVGRVIHVEKTDAGEQVTIAPVELTDVITDGEFGGKDLALDVRQSITYSTGEGPWSVTDLPPSGNASAPPDTSPSPAASPGSSSSPTSSAAAIHLAAFHPGATERPVGLEAEGDPAQPPPDNVSKRPPPPDPSWGGATPASAGDFHLTPICCDGGVGAHLNYNNNGLKVDGTLQVVGAQPKAHWEITIRGAHIEHAQMSVSGAVGVKFSFDASTSSGLAGNVSKQVMLPGTLEFPAVAAGVPFMFRISQSLLLRTAFSAKDGKLSASGEWSFGGGLGFSYAPSTGLVPVKPQGLGIQQSLLDSIKGASVGVSGLVLAHRVELRVGIGWSIFHIGPYVDTVASIGVSRGSDLGAPLVLCRGADLGLWVGAGVGYRLPKVVVDIVNFFLRTFGAKEIASEGSIARIQALVVQKHAVVPETKICGEG